MDYPKLHGAASPNLRLILSSLAVLFLLSSCQTILPLEPGSWPAHQAQLQTLHNWEFRGRVNIRYEDESHTPTINWLQHSSDYRVDLWGTFNAGRTVITGSPGHVTLEQSNQLYSAASPEQMMLDRLGYELPVSMLTYWIKGLPVPTSQYSFTLNEFNLAATIEQQGWHIVYSDYRNIGEFTLPRRVELSHESDNIRLRFIRLNWSQVLP